MPSPLVTTQWLQDNLDNERLVLIDASMATVIGKEPIVYDRPVWIPGSRQIDLEGVLCDTGSSQTHAFPTEEQVTREAQRLGIRRRGPGGFSGQWALNTFLFWMEDCHSG